MNNKIGELHLILGSMYSCKTSELIKQMLRYQSIGHRVCCINSSKDIRTPNNELKTHDNHRIPALKTTHLLSETLYIPYNVSVIGIDEAQFFDDLIPFVKDKVENKFIVIVAGLDGDFKQQVFGDILKLIPIADTYKKMYSMCSICKDGSIGSFTKRITNEDQQELIGSTGNYISVCRKHLTFNDF